MTLITTPIIAFILLVIAAWCGLNYLFIVVMHYAGRLYNETEANERAFQFGLCCILALGFLGLLIR